MIAQIPAAKLSIQLMGARPEGQDNPRGAKFACILWRKAPKPSGLLRESPSEATLVAPERCGKIMAEICRRMHCAHCVRGPQNLQTKLIEEASPCLVGGRDHEATCAPFPHQRPKDGSSSRHGADQPVVLQASREDPRATKDAAKEVLP